LCHRNAASASRLRAKSHVETVFVPGSVKRDVVVENFCRRHCIFILHLVNSPEAGASRQLGGCRLCRAKGLRPSGKRTHYLVALSRKGTNT